MKEKVVIKWLFKYHFLTKISHDMMYYTHLILIYKTPTEKIVIKWLFKYHFLKKKNSDMI